MSTKPPLDVNQPPLSVIDPDVGEVDPGDPSEAEVRQVEITSSLHGIRLDLALASLIPEFSRSYLQQVLEQGGVSDTNLTPWVKPSQKVKAGQRFVVTLRPTEIGRAHV